jgi:hypothetical protein
MMPAITVRFIAHLAPSDEPFESRHCWWGGPNTPRQNMPRPDVLLLEGDDRGHAMVYRYTASGEFAGDSWYESVEFAKESCVGEYGAEGVGSWEPVPPSEKDAHEFAIRRAAEKKT